MIGIMVLDQCGCCYVRLTWPLESIPHFERKNKLGGIWIPGWGPDPVGITNGRFNPEWN